jgi:hypothetical protein
MVRMKPGQSTALHTLTHLSQVKRDQGHVGSTAERAGEAVRGACEQAQDARDMVPLQKGVWDVLVSSPLSAK